MSQISLSWKPYNVNVEKVHLFFKTNLSANYDGIICNPEALLVCFLGEVESEDSDVVNSYWDGLTSNSFLPTLQEILVVKINDAIEFGNQLVVQAAVENIAMGITQAGKTKAVADLFVDLQYYLRTGSLYAAISELDRIIAEDLDPSLAPFVTEARLNGYKTQIQTYLSS